LVALILTIISYNVASSPKYTNLNQIIVSLTYWVSVISDVCLRTVLSSLRTTKLSPSPALLTPGLLGNVSNWLISQNSLTTSDKLSALKIQEQIHSPPWPWRMQNDLHLQVIYLCGTTGASSPPGWSWYLLFCHTTVASAPARRLSRHCPL
jgi:predicted transcriptional regulator